jgi:hypothetical protein
MQENQLALFDAEAMGPRIQRSITLETTPAPPSVATTLDPMLRVRWGSRRRTTWRTRSRKRPAKSYASGLRAWLRSVATAVRYRRNSRTPLSVPRYRGRKGSVREIVSSRPGPTDRISTGTPTSSSMRST